MGNLVAITPPRIARSAFRDHLPKNLTVFGKDFRIESEDVICFASDCQLKTMDAPVVRQTRTDRMEKIGVTAAGIKT